MNRISDSLKENQNKMNQILSVDKNFDVLLREMEMGGRRCGFYFIDGFTKDEVMQKNMTSFFGLKPEDMPASAKEFARQQLPYIEIDLLYEYDQVVKNILSGVTCMFVQGYEACLAIDCRTYPVRSIEEPEKDKSLRGSRDGFVETVVFNTALIRRRIRDPHLVMEMKEIGTKTRTDVVLSYMENEVDQKLLKRVEDRLKQMHLSELRMGTQSLARALYHGKWFDPFPKFKYTERPDTAAACLLEGKIVILVDNSPAALILPTSMLDMIEEANDYYFPPFTGVYLKVTRVLITFLTVFLTPFYLLLCQHSSWLPDAFRFIQMKEAVNIPVFWQFLILELAIDGLRLAALNTPNMLTTPLSIIAGLVLGEFSVKSGWFNAEVMLYTSFVAVANYTQPNFELGYALKFMRLFLLVVTALFSGFGYLAGGIMVLLCMLLGRTLAGNRYVQIRKK